MPLNRLTTQRRLLQWAGGDAHGCSNDALVQSIFNSGPDWADYGRAAFAWRDRRSSDHCVRTQGGPHAHHSRERRPSHLEYWCCRPAWVAAIRQLADGNARPPCNGREKRYLMVVCTVITEV